MNDKPVWFVVCVFSYFFSYGCSPLQSLGFLVVVGCVFVI